MRKVLHDSNFHLPYNPKLIPIAQQLRKHPTPAEKKLWQNFLRNFPVRVLRQRPIDNFIVDFYCAALMLVIEVDGESHFTEQGKQHDPERTEILEGYGLKILRFTNVEVYQNFQGVCQELLNLIAADSSGQLPGRHHNSRGEPETLLSPPDQGGI